MTTRETTTRHNFQTGHVLAIQCDACGKTVTEGNHIPRSEVVHTATPWRVLDGAILSDVINDYGNFVVVDCNRERTPQDEANLRLISRAVNSHAQLVAALEQFVSIYPSNARRHPDVAIAIQAAEEALVAAR